MLTAGAACAVVPLRREAVDIADYAMEAEREATDAGMAFDELDGVLNGETITALVPPHLTEDVVAYGVRATGEILVRYIVEDPGSRDRMD